jgi:hypothetical protein
MVDGGGHFVDNPGFGSVVERSVQFQFLEGVEIRLEIVCLPLGLWKTPKLHLDRRSDHPPVQLEIRLRDANIGVVQLRVGSAIVPLQIPKGLPLEKHNIWSDPGFPLGVASLHRPVVVADK